MKKAASIFVILFTASSLAACTDDSIEPLKVKDTLPPTIVRPDSTATAVRTDEGDRTDEFEPTPKHPVKPNSDDPQRGKYQPATVENPTLAELAEPPKPTVEPIVKVNSIAPLQ